MKTFYNRIVDFLFPVYCFGCKSGGVFLCYKCINSIEKSEENKDIHIHSLFNYKNKIIKRVLWKLKYEERYAVAEILGQILHDKILEELSEGQMFGDMQNILIVPIPLSKKSFRKRGYNQSELIAKSLCKEGIETYELTTDTLYKIRETINQMSLKNKRDRLNNLKNAFSAKHSLAKNRNIILIDDVTTTGATISEARKTLLSAGAKTVTAYTIAH